MLIICYNFYQAAAKREKHKFYESSFKKRKKKKRLILKRNGNFFFPWRCIVHNVIPLGFVKVQYTSYIYISYPQQNQPQIYDCLRIDISIPEWEEGASQSSVTATNSSGWRLRNLFVKHSF